MARDPSIPPESLEEILAWLHPDREAAGVIYVQLRQDLAKIFMWNHCNDPEGLTDQVFDRVAKKVHQLRETYEGDPRLFFYGVQRNLIKEASKKVKTQVSLEDCDLPTNDPEVEETENMREECLHSCLQKLSPEKRELILNYYAKEKQAKIEHRTEMARQLGTTVETLRVRVYRLRATLEECIERCLNRMAQRK
ncbi:MAG TPA: sigma-70 family RNA polymerase sigma factor [Pyrinomonadaceae bacterium]|nr:sigma-70 family RNA polymerase sigma factor [Pyrinomonadaceae bacterium]